MTNVTVPLRFVERMEEALGQTENGHTVLIPRRILQYRSWDEGEKKYVWIDVPFVGAET